MKTVPLAASIASLLEQPAPSGWHSFLQQQQQEGEGDAGGGTAVADAGDAGGADPNADILSFEMPDAGAIADGIVGKGTPKAPPVTPPAKKEPVTPPAKGSEPGKEEPVAKLRTSYETLKREHAELKSKFEAGDPRVKALEAERDEAKRNWDESKKRNEEYETKLALSNPAVVKELREMDEKYDKQAQRFYGSVPEISHPVISQLVQKYSRLPFGQANYREAREAFETEVNAALGAGEGEIHRKLEKTLGWIEDTADFAKQRPDVERRVHANARQLSQDAETKSFGEKKSHFTNLAKAALTVPEGMEKTDPMHPRVIIKNFDDQLEPAVREKLDAGIIDFADLALNGVPPRTEKDYAGLSPQQIQERQATEQKRVQQARDHAVDVMVNGARALRRLPVLMQMLAKYKEKAAKLGDGEPPVPGDGEGGDTQDGDLKNLKMPEIPSDL